LGDIQFYFALAININGYFAAGGEGAKQELVGQGLANRILDESRHRPRAHGWVEAVLGKVSAQGPAFAPDSLMSMFLEGASRAGGKRGQQISQDGPVAGDDGHIHPDTGYQPVFVASLPEPVSLCFDPDLVEGTLVR